ncbi:MAG TPA: IS200/IS605 family transposase [Opitutales bacterium]|jgi:putative transposase|nr:IS200/IS605 family transposase [Opitutales bacterium]
MANTYASLFYHVIFSTKNRENYIHRDIEARIWAYLGGIARENGFTALCVGGIENHLHLLLRLPPNTAVSKAVQLLKGGSSAWIKGQADMLGMKSFAWQDGYAVFTVSKSQVGEVKNYINSQREHHRKKTFAEEYRAFLAKHEIKADEKYLLG